MGKIRVSTLGSEEEAKVREERKVAREQKKLREGAGKVHIAGMKGGERIKSVGADDDIEKFAKIAQDVEKDQAEGIKTEGSEEKPKREKKKRVRGKKYLAALTKVDRMKHFPIKEALKLLREVSLSKFDPSVELHINMKEKGLRGTVAYPHGTGKQIRVVIADDSTVEKVQKGQIDFDILIAHPSMMPKLAKVARILGPKGLMPNPKNGTISPEPEKVAAKFKKGEVQWKTEADFPIVHQVIGKLSFKDSQLEENHIALIKALGEKVVNVTLKSSMSPGIKVKV